MGSASTGHRRTFAKVPRLQQDVSERLRFVWRAEVLRRAPIKSATLHMSLMKVSIWSQGAVGIMHSYRLWCIKLVLHSECLQNACLFPHVPVLFLFFPHFFPHASSWRNMSDLGPCVPGCLFIVAVVDPRGLHATAQWSNACLAACKEVEDVLPEKILEILIDSNKFW